MPFLVASLILPALLTWFVGDALRWSDEDRFLVFVALFVVTFLGSIVGAHLLEHGQRHRRNQEVQELGRWQAIQLSLVRHREGVGCALLLLVGAVAWVLRPHAMDKAMPEQGAMAASAAPVAVPPASTPTAAATTTTTAPTTAEAKAAALIADMAALELVHAHDAVFAWAQAWSARRVDEYLAAYSADFVPADNVPRKQWEQVRRQRVGGANSIIVVSVQNLDVEPVGKDRVQAMFVQKYQSGEMADLTRKKLVLKRESNAWKILSEQATPLKS